MNEGEGGSRAASGTAHRPDVSPPPPLPPRPDAGARTSAWTAGRVTAAVIGGLLILVSVGVLGFGGVALWADRTQRDAAGYVTTDTRRFSSAGSALVTERIDLGSPGVDWLYSRVALGNVRIRVASDGPDAELFVGIARSADADRYLEGVGHTLISDFLGHRVRAVDGGRPSSPPGAQDFWAASASGPGSPTVTWDPANGSWTVVVMNADGAPGLDGVATDLGAEMPALLWIAIGALVAGGLFLAGGAALIAGAVRRANRA